MVKAVTSNTPKRILFDAGSIHKGLKYVEGTGWNFEESFVGATSGGSKFTITPEIYKIPVDRANVNVMGLTKKTGETATMEINFAELTKDLIKSTIIGVDGTSEDEMYDLIESKANIEEGDYWENIAYVGETVEGEKIIVILDNALCTSGLPIEGKAKAEGVATVTFECYAKLDGDHDKLPYHIYTPKSLGTN